MSLLLLLLFAAVVLACASLVQSDGKNLNAWAVLLLCVVIYFGGH